MRRFGAAAAVMMALAGCGPDVGALVEAQARWASGGPASYRYAFATTGFASPVDLLVTVRSGAVEQVVRTGTSLPDTSGAGQTVEQLFLDVQGRLRSSCAVTARYDASLGFPLSAYSDCGQEGDGWEVSGLQGL